MKLEIVNINGIEGMLIIMDKGIKYEVPYYEDLKQNENNINVFTLDFYFENDRFVAVSGNKASYIMPYDIYIKNPDCFINFSCMDSDNAYVVNAYAPFLGRNNKVYESSSYLSCLKYISERMEKPDIEFIVTFNDGSSINIIDTEDLYVYDERLISRIDVNVDFAGRIDLSINLIIKSNGDFILNGGMANYKPIIENYDIVKFLNKFVKEYDVKKVLISDTNQNQTPFFVGINSWFCSRKLFESDNSVKANFIKNDRRCIR